MVTISYELYPSIVDNIIESAPWEVKLVFRLTSKRFLTKVDNDIYKQVLASHRSWVLRMTKPYVTLSMCLCCPLWPGNRAIPMSPKLGTECRIFHHRFSERWRAISDKIQDLDAHVLDTTSVSARAEPVPRRRRGRPWKYVATVSAPLPFGTIYIVQTMRFAKETERDRASRRHPQEIALPCLQVRHDNKYMWSPFVDHIVNIEIDPFYDKLHVRPVAFAPTYLGATPNLGTSLWLFFLRPESLTWKGLPESTSFPASFKDSYVGNVLRPFMTFRFYHCTLVGLETIPAQLLGLPDTTKAEDVPTLVTKGIASMINDRYKTRPNRAKFGREGKRRISLRTVADLEADPAVKELLERQKSSPPVPPMTNSHWCSCA